MLLIINILGSERFYCPYEVCSTTGVSRHIITTHIRQQHYPELARVNLGGKKSVIWKTSAGDIIDFSGINN